MILAARTPHLTNVAVAVAKHGLIVGTNAEATADTLWAAEGTIGKLAENDRDAGQSKNATKQGPY
jgi:hypothetical protein